MAKTLNFPPFSCLVNQNNIFCARSRLKAESPLRLSPSSVDGPALAKLGLAFTVLLAFGNEFPRGRGVQEFHVDLFKSTD